MNKYPELVIDLKKLENNIINAKELCSKNNIMIAGVIKGFNGLFELVKKYDDLDIPFIASSRLEHLSVLIGKVKAKLMYIRIPMLSEVEDVVRISDVSLNSEVSVLRALNKEALKQNKIHNVILMCDLGDLREGFWNKEEIISASLLVENELSNLHLLGVGTNLGCYGSIVPTVEKLNELVSICEDIESKIGRKLEIISGGASTSIPRLIENNMPSRINNLRIGEWILLPKQFNDLWGYDNKGMNYDVFKLRCEVIEVKSKPSYPVGEISVDAFGHKTTYEDIGIRKRALVALGKVDYAYLEDLILNEEGAFLVGASSDHTIIDITDAKRDIKVGDIIEFDLTYSTMVNVTQSSNINVVYI